MPVPQMQLELSHVITIVVVLVGYLTASLLAWGRLRADVHAMKETQGTLVSASDLRAAVAEMKIEIYRAVGSAPVERRDPDGAHDRRQSGV